ncbi:MAG: citrate/2-methylcitrate synthase [Lachnospiraceae bacterium]|nr:citrate/2-methylcitrate synthase [Lachnospiraceae bacterium]
MNEFTQNDSYYQEKEHLCIENDTISRGLYQELDVKAGLRDLNGKGVLAGLTNISEIKAFANVDGAKTPCDGELLYRGYDVKDLIRGSANRKFAYEETAYLLIFGQLPTQAELEQFCQNLGEKRTIPSNFTRDVIMKAPSHDIMNSMTRSVLTLASYDDNAADLSISNVLRQCVQLVSIFPMLAVYGYHAYNHYENDESMYIHRPDASLSTAENFLRMLRPDMNYTPLEARVLDVALLLHAEHGGGNNSSFTTRVVTSSGSDTYSAIAAALCSLKGPRHGGANLMVMQMMDDIKAHVRDYEDEEEIYAYLAKILAGEAFDHKGLIYGMGHAVYSLSDPREVIFKGFVESLAAEKGMEKEMALYNNIEKAAPKLIAEKRKIYKGVSPNVDFYSGFVYQMLGIPRELYTPLFAVARIAGWSAHRIEELVSANKIIRPAYKSLVVEKPYIDREQREDTDK